MEQDNLDEIIDIFCRTTNPKIMRKLFSEIMTPQEIADITKRWFIMKELARGVPQRKIASDMEVSLCKITRGAKILKQDDSEFRRILYEIFDETHL